MALQGRVVSSALKVHLLASPSLLGHHPNDAKWQSAAREGSPVLDHTLNITPNTILLKLLEYYYLL